VRTPIRGGIGAGEIATLASLTALTEREVAGDFTDLTVFFALAMVANLLGCFGTNSAGPFKRKKPETLRASNLFITIDGSSGSARRMEDAQRSIIS
jgi:hypothetical protein